jgi:hypothetical protein
MSNQRPVVISYDEYVSTHGFYCGKSILVDYFAAVPIPPRRIVVALHQLLLERTSAHFHFNGC